MKRGRYDKTYAIIDFKGKLINVCDMEGICKFLGLQEGTIRRGFLNKNVRAKGLYYVKTNTENQFSMQHPLNQMFDQVFCLNLDRRVDRREQAEKEFADFGINVQFVSGVDGQELSDTGKLSSDGLSVSKGDMGCTLSHLKIIKIAKQRGLKQILIFEDDVQFAPTLNLTFGDYYTKLPSDWDMWYFGGNHAGGFEMINEKIARIKKTYTTHAYAVKETVYDEMIRVLSETEKVDISISSLHEKFNCYVCRPHIAFQRDGFSDILNRETNYFFLRD